ncbi:hypothetical protein HNQ88_000877 [Aureibacter tunicatorum]|uniref:Uncharacterized protein n=1 Tax=Aureibacter tunicatorum TaxID=866807 RepID=A0AAE3XLD1_9BACT|nr:hypothetical protein [Aureibacter tunicatorum]BDD02934.1 hypothetical protein AUTU_04170 [Aureibacter tunicatorum]
MKIKKSKKRFAFTEKQKRKDRHPFALTIGKSCKVWANRLFRRENKRILKRIRDEDKEIAFIRHRKFLSWYVD